MLFSVLRFELVCISFRKPLWDWALDTYKAQNNGAIAPNPIPPEYDVNGPLFTQDWIDRIVRSGEVKPGRYNNNVTPVRDGAKFEKPAPKRMAAAADYYPGVLPGFVLGCLGDNVDESLQRYVSALSFAALF